jgi:hypothetical protein
MLFHKNRARGVSIWNFMEIDQNPHNPHCRNNDTKENYSQLVCLRASPSVFAVSNPFINVTLEVQI